MKEIDKIPRAYRPAPFSWIHFEGADESPCRLLEISEHWSTACTQTKISNKQLTLSLSQLHMKYHNINIIVLWHHTTIFKSFLKSVLYCYWGAWSSSASNNNNSIYTLLHRTITLSEVSLGEQRGSYKTSRREELFLRQALMQPWIWSVSEFIFLHQWTPDKQDWPAWLGLQWQVPGWLEGTSNSDAAQLSSLYPQELFHGCRKRNKILLYNLSAQRAIKHWQMFLHARKRRAASQARRRVAMGMKS